MNPHELLGAWLVERLGPNRFALWGDSREQLFEPLVLGLVDQLASYADMTPGARIRIKNGVRVREGRERSYLLAELVDRKRPLKLRDATARWGIEMSHPDRIDEFVGRTNASRWRFVERHMPGFIEPLVDGITGQLATYYARRPSAVPHAGLTRVLEDVSGTYLCCEIDDRGEAPMNTNDTTVSRYMVQ